MQTITANLSAGERKEFSLPGAMFFMLLETIGPVDIEMHPVSGQSRESADGVESGFREKALSGADKIGKVVFFSATSQVIKFGYSVRDADNRKVTSTVAVTDGSVEIVKDGRAFSKYMALGQLAANYNNFQMLNPAGSGKRAVISSVLGVVTTGTAGFSFLSYSTALANSLGGGVNKLIGALDDGVMEFYSEQIAGILSGGEVFLAAKAIQNENVAFDLDQPVILNPGEGLLIRPGTVNLDVIMTVQYHVEGV